MILSKIQKLALLSIGVAIGSTMLLQVRPASAAQIPLPQGHCYETRYDTYTVIEDTIWDEVSCVSGDVPGTDFCIGYIMKYDPAVGEKVQQAQIMNCTTGRVLATRQPGRASVTALMQERPELFTFDDDLTNNTNNSGFNTGADPDPNDATQTPYVAIKGDCEGQDTDGDGDIDTANLDSSNCGIIRYLEIVVNALSALVGVIVVISIIVAGIQYTMAGSDAQKITAAKGRIRNSIIALLVFIFTYAFLSYLIPGGLF